MTTLVAVFDPSGTITTTRSPVVDWSVSGTPQTAYEVKIFSAAQYGAGGFNPATSIVTYFSGTVPSGTSDARIYTTLANGTTYKAYVRVADGTVGSYSWSAWMAGSAFNIAIPVPTPTPIYPVNASTVSLSRPSPNASVSAPMADSVPMKRVWQFCTSNTFASGVVTVTDPSYSSLPVGAITFPSLPARLAQGNWYYRVRLEDMYGIAGSWSSTSIFSITHQPTGALQSPASGNTVQYASGGNVTLSWTFTDPDPDDYQTAYQIIVAISGGATILDTGAVTTPIQPGDTYAAVVAIPSSNKDTLLTWTLLVCDQDGEWQSTAPKSFITRDNPTVAITAPTSGSTVATPTPTFTWSFGPTGRFRGTWNLTVTNLDTGLVVHTALGFGSSTYTPSSSIVGIGDTYRVTVAAHDTLLLLTTVSSDFTASYTPPTAPSFTLDGIYFSETGGVVVDWTGSVVDAGFTAWRIYRRLLGATTWKLVRELTLAEVSFTDYTCPSITSVEYAVVQVAVNATFGSPVESTYDPEPFEGECENYFIVVPDWQDLNTRLDIVTSEQLGDEYEQATLNLIGRGRRQETGTRFGVTGSMTAQLYDDSTRSARDKKIAIENIRLSQLKPYLRNPFGDVWSIGLLSAGYSRIAGVGAQEFTTVSIDYSEIEDS